MPRTLYSPRLSDDIIRALYREGKRRRMPMTRLADELILAALAGSSLSAGLPICGFPTAHAAESATPGRQAA
ncbi:hypothetical protein HZ994_02595 [Akkermansiaceae bacterium]|nr:hypothetical protein HZ994_02595 [Akkermansiaceae bacterium]